MQRVIVAALCALISSTAYAETRSSPDRRSELLRTSGFVYWAHCDKKCGEMKCPDTKVCYNACVENKGTLSMCPRAEGKRFRFFAEIGRAHV